VNFDKKVNGNLGATDASTTWYLDLSSTYDVSENFTIRAGVLNLLNQEARFYTPDNQDGTDPETYDIIGRRFFVGGTFKM
jgi:outer membrane receptor for ferrienterochelin and colicin